MEKTIRISLDGDDIYEFTLDFDDFTEDEIYESVVEYVFLNIGIEVI